MIVSCSSCSTRFTVDPAVLGAHGRRVRCARCGHTWHQMPEVDAPPAEAAPEHAEPTLSPPDWHGVEPESRPEPQPESEPRRRSAGGWLLFAAVVFLLAAGILAGQERIVGAWPAAGRLYETIGMADPVPGRGLEIRDVAPEARLEDGGRSLVVTGRVVNPSDSAVDLPAIRAALLDEGGNVVAELSTALGPARLEGGQDAGFAIEFADPPKPAVRITVAFEEPAGR